MASGSSLTIRHTRQFGIKLPKNQSYAKSKKLITRPHINRASTSSHVWFEYGWKTQTEIDEIEKDRNNSIILAQLQEIDFKSIRAIRRMTLSGLKNTNRTN